MEIPIERYKAGPKIGILFITLKILGETGRTEPTRIGYEIEF